MAWGWAAHVHLGNGQLSHLAAVQQRQPGLHARHAAVQQLPGRPRQGEANAAQADADLHMRLHVRPACSALSPAARHACSCLSA